MEYRIFEFNDAFKDFKNYSLIEETLPFYEGEEEKIYKYALSSVI